VSQTTKRRPRSRDAAKEPTSAEVRRRRTDRRVRWTVVAVVSALLVVMATVAALSQRDTGTTRTSKDTVVDTAAVPVGVDAVTWAVPVAPDVTPKTGAPQLDIWADFQCPACAQAEQATGASILALAKSGEVKVTWRVTSFLDARIPGENSQRAGAAWGCAIDAGRAAEYHARLFASQPAVEGAGYPDAQLLRVGRSSGIKGADYQTFRSCVDEGRYLQWVANSTAEFHKAAVPGTPAGYLNGRALPSGTLYDPAALSAALAAGS
jgi:protein-disulfide isomerase